MTRMWKRTIIAVALVAGVVGFLIMYPPVIDMGTKRDRAVTTLRWLSGEIERFYKVQHRLPRSLDELDSRSDVLRSRAQYRVGYSGDPESLKVRLWGYYRQDGEDRVIAIEFLADHYRWSPATDTRADADSDRSGPP